MSELTVKKCVPCEGGVAPLSADEARRLLAQVPGWEMDKSSKVIYRDFIFKNFYQVMAFVNAVAFLAYQENHHPDLEVGFQHCLVRYSTHAIDGISENDFICAAKVNGLLGN